MMQPTHDNTRPLIAHLVRPGPCGLHEREGLPGVSGTCRRKPPAQIQENNTQPLYSALVQCSAHSSSAPGASSTCHKPPF
eukprot:1160945-Pelagomonas_calceolata.AAC.9